MKKALITYSQIHKFTEKYVGVPKPDLADVIKRAKEISRESGKSVEIEALSKAVYEFHNFSEENDILNTLPYLDKKEIKNLKKIAKLKQYGGKKVEEKIRKLSSSIDLQKQSGLTKIEINPQSYSNGIEIKKMFKIWTSSIPEFNPSDEWLEQDKELEQFNRTYSELAVKYRDSRGKYNSYSRSLSIEGEKNSPLSEGLIKEVSKEFGDILYIITGEKENLEKDLSNITKVLFKSSVS